MARHGDEQILRRVRQSGTPLGQVEVASATGHHVFDLYALGGDRFAFQRMPGEARRLAVLVRRSALRTGRQGMLFALCAGHFGTFLTPLLSGAFGSTLCRVPRVQSSHVLAHQVVLGRISERGIDLLQRDTAITCLVEADRWLQAQGLGLDEISFCERTPEVLAYTEPLGQVWRVRPRVYAVDEMRAIVRMSHLPMETEARYYVSLRGVHWLTYAEVERLARLARQSPEAVLACVREWVCPLPGETQAAVRRPKGSAGCFAVSFFGIAREVAEQLLIPALEQLPAAAQQGRLEGLDVADSLAAVAKLYLHALQDGAYANPMSERAVLALYARISDDATAEKEDRIDFDARRIALPGVTFRPDGSYVAHPQADRQTLTVVDHFSGRLSFDEHIEHINIYEIRSSKNLLAGSGKSREIVLKTDRNPVPISYIQKRLGSVRAGYANYLLTRVNVFRALGADYPAFQLLTVSARGQARKETPYFLRTRSVGDPLSAIDPSLFRADPTNPKGAELPEVVLALATLYGAAAAQNLAVKKCVLQPAPTCRFGIGKEIFAFAYDPFMHRLMPQGVQVCSIRGAMGWANLTQEDDNLREAHRFYLRVYATVLGEYWHTHAEACTLNECAAAFFDGFERKIEAMYWNYCQHKANFDSFNPALRAIYNFRAKLDFTLWALDRAAKDLPALREHFMDYVRDAFVKV